MSDDQYSEYPDLNPALIRNLSMGLDGGTTPTPTPGQVDPYQLMLKKKTVRRKNLL